ncbi:MAG: hypothetical protein WAQ53_05755 [Thiofilum sp.]|uniref:hypothetical protein n=1 Tax=Thiofilum sp. TaxID=2212733 RepID=UPI0025FAB4B8|nr:hypothetical protein [Thiofilum sp.]MBK8453716.1 hypothetical protein [Thiofilum sp.]
MDSAAKRQLYRVLIKSMVMLGIVVLIGVLVRSVMSTPEPETQHASLVLEQKFTVPLNVHSGKVQLIRWGQQEVGVLHLTDTMKASLKLATDKDTEPNLNPQTRARHPDYFVYINKGSGVGCPITLVTTQQALLRDTCTQATYDLAGRPLNATLRLPVLTVPPHYFKEGKITLGAWEEQ